MKFDDICRKEDSIYLRCVQTKHRNNFDYIEEFLGFASGYVFRYAGRPTGVHLDRCGHWVATDLKTGLQIGGWGAMCYKTRTGLMNRMMEDCDLIVKAFSEHADVVKEAEDIFSDFVHRKIGKDVDITKGLE